jgi:hypothetical protein
MKARVLIRRVSFPRVQIRSVVSGSTSPKQLWDLGCSSEEERKKKAKASFKKVGSKKQHGSHLWVRSEDGEMAW